MPQGIFAWQEKGHREAHPEGERETGRRPRERESTFLGEKPVPDASGGGLSLCGSLGQERGKKTPLGAGGGGSCSQCQLGGARTVRVTGPGAGKENSPGGRGRRDCSRYQQGGAESLRVTGPRAGKENSSGGRGRRDCSRYQQGGAESVRIVGPGAGIEKLLWRPRKAGTGPVPCATAGKVAPCSPKKGKRKRPGKHLPGLSFVSRRRSRALARFCITSMSPSLSRGDGRKSHTR